MKIKDIPDSSKPKERFLKLRPGALSDGYCIVNVTFI